MDRRRRDHGADDPSIPTIGAPPDPWHQVKIIPASAPRGAELWRRDVFDGTLTAALRPTGPQGQAPALALGHRTRDELCHQHDTTPDAPRFGGRMPTVPELAEAVSRFAPRGAILALMLTSGAEPQAQDWPQENVVLLQQIGQVVPTVAPPGLVGPRPA